MKKYFLSLNGVNLLTKTSLKQINGGYDPDGEKEEGNLCNGTGPAKNRCGSGLYCDVTGANIGICKKAEITHA